ncbi:secretogranin-1 [Mixophyes fleayi]|uniref:secretogranin-1 n=1 Tax=Mixophyes fleayi TaxID=3061075 RepID=UPI003F4E32FC
MLRQTGEGRGTMRRKMPPVLVLLSFLMFTLEVTAAPFDKGVRPEEMVTRCIVEVLSNALAKPNAPAIDPECKEILKKNSRHSIDETQDEQKQYETRNIKDSVSAGKHQFESSEEGKESSDLPKEENEKRHHADNENSENKVERALEHIDEKEESTGHSKERHFVDDDEDGDEERGDHKDNNEKDEIIKKYKYHHDDSQEAKHDIFDKKLHHADKSVEEFSKENDEDLRNLDEIKRHIVSKSSKERLFHPGKFNSAHSNEVSEESVEREEEKRSYKPMHDELGQRLLGYEEKRSYQDKGNHIVFDRGQKTHYGKDSLENILKKNKYDKRTYSEKETSEESREKRHHIQDSEEEREHHDSSEESSEKEQKGHRYDEKRYHEDRKRWPSQQNSRLNYEQSNEDNKESDDDIDKCRERDRLEKEKFYRKLRHHLQDSEEDESYKHEKKQEDKRHYIGEEMVDEMKRYYPGFSHEKDPRHYNEESTEESNNLDSDNNNRHNSEEDETRLFNKYGVSDDPLRWKSRYFENNDNSKEERKRSLQAQKMFPDYGDYDLWGKRQFLEDMNHGYGEKRSPLKFHKFEQKRQHDRMDDLAQLLNYKKKSVEFPDFYDSEEIKKRNYNERERLSQRPLTEEEEKELKNLAIMDMELQKIAEKLSNNRQG